MNKDIIYIEPEDDITDIISNIKSAKQKVVALVPPKKLGVLSSAINIRLIAKTGKSAKKAVVLVTDHPTLMKLAAMSELPVAASLNSRPSVPSHNDIAAADESADNPTVEEEAEEAAKETSRADITEDFTAAPEGLNLDTVATKSTKSDKFEKSEDIVIDEIEEEEKEDQGSKADDEEDPEVSKTSEKSEKSKKTKDSSEEDKSPLAFIKGHLKLIGIAAATLILLVAFLIWANVFAPAATISVQVGTTSANFSENVSFTTNQSEEDAKSGKFYLEAIERKESLSGKLEATEEKDVGEKAKGSVTISYTFSEDDDISVTLPAGTALSQDGLGYTTNSAVTLTSDDCTRGALRNGTCAASASADITANAAGDKSNCDSGTTFSVAASGFSATASSAISGGSSKVIKVVQQSDIDKAVSDAKKLNDSEAKDLLKKELKDGYIIIDSSFKAEASDAKPSVELGKEADKDAKVSLDITYRIYAVDSARIEEYIHEKAKLASDQKIYSLGNPYIERFTEADGGAITGKLKTSYKAGPEVTEENIMGKVQGKKVGEAQSLLKSINGVESVNIETSFFWVNSIPDDPNKITISIEVED